MDRGEVVELEELRDGAGLGGCHEETVPGVQIRKEGQKRVDVASQQLLLD